MEAEETGEFPAHVATEFFLWLWFRSETGGGTVEIGDGVTADFWVDDRLSFRTIGEEKVSAVMTGEHPAGTPEAKAALLGGKVIRDLRLAIRREDREYAVTLKGSGIEIGGAKLPGLVKTGDVAEILYERMFLYEELHYVVTGLFRAFAAARCGDDWTGIVLPGMKAWAENATEPGRDGVGEA